MAGIRIGGASGAVTTATSTLTLYQIVAASNHRVRVERIRVSCRGTSNSDAPVLVELLKQTDAGTASAATLVKLVDADPGTIQTAAQKTFTAEPTAGNSKAQAYIHPQSHYDFVFPISRDLYVDGGDRLGIRAVSPAQATTLDVQWEGEE